MLFSVYKLGRELLLSPQFYLIVLATVGVSVIVDGVHLNLQREFRTPLAVLFRSLEKNEKFTKDERDAIYSKIVKLVQTP